MNQEKAENQAQDQIDQDEQELTKLREEADSVQAEEAEPEKELAEESPPSEDTEEQQPEPDEGKEEAKPDVVQEQDSENLSQRAQERYRKLTSRLKETTSEAERLRIENDNLLNVIQELQTQGYSRQEAEDIASDIDQSQIDPERFKRDVALHARTIVNAEISKREQQMNHQRAQEHLREDLERVEKEYTILDETSPEYDDKLAGVVADVYRQRVSAKPETRLTDVAEEVMKLYKRAGDEGVRKQSDKIVKKAASQAMSPTGGETKIDNLADKIGSADSLDELEALRASLPQE
jgi:hypothetical protein